VVGYSTTLVTLGGGVHTLSMLKAVVRLYRALIYTL